MIDSIIILGGHIQALGLARQAKSRQLKTILIAKDSFSIARFSHTIDQTIICKGDEDLIYELKQHESRSTMLFPTSDDYIKFILVHYDWLNSSFFLALPEKKTAELFADKRLTYCFAENNDIPHPKSWYPSTYESILTLAQEVSYPVVLKPAIMYTFHKLFGKKAFLCTDKDDLINRVNCIQDRFPIDQLIIQEFLPGGPECLYSYGVLSLFGDPLAHITAHRIRQNPMDFGNSTTFAISCDIEAIESSARRILKLTNYTGLAEIEFMLNDGEFKFLEVNTRAWKWHTLSLGRSFGFLSSWIDHLNQTNTNQFENDELVTWQERLTDWTVLLKELIKGHMKVRDFFRKQPGKRTYAVWSPKDPLPAIMYVLLSPILYFKRH